MSIMVELALHRLDVFMDERRLEMNMLCESCRGCQQRRQMIREMHAGMESERATVPAADYEERNKINNTLNALYTSLEG